VEEHSLEARNATPARARELLRVETYGVDRAGLGPEAFDERRANHASNAESCRHSGTCVRIDRLRYGPHGFRNPVSDLATGWDDNTTSHGRPTVATFGPGPDGRLYIGDDAASEIFWIAPVVAP
jgi:hypothetical protein